MRILVLSKEAWRDEENGGNVLSNIFTGIEAEFAQIYCTSKEPNNNICKIYYQMTDKMMVKNILKCKSIGKHLKYDIFPKKTNNNKEDFSSVQRLHLDFIRVARELVWYFAKWDTPELRQFANDFKPDLIFAPCYGNHYMLRLTRIIAQECSVPVISYISDDFYGNTQFHFSPIYWVNHFLLRKHVRETFPLYRLVYTMTDEQKKQCEKDFNAPMKILRKSGKFDNECEKKSVNSPIRLVYGGGIYLNRWKTLCALAKTIKEINENGMKMVLDIYTASEITSKYARILNDGTHCRMHKAVSMDELKKKYSESDIALHVEGFDLKNRLAVQLSFSTKIVDCLDSGCAVMAICDKKQAGFSYLKNNNAAICISDISELRGVLSNIVDNPDSIIVWQKRAFALGRKNHIEENIRQMLHDDFYEVLGWRQGKNEDITD